MRNHQIYFTSDTHFYHTGILEYRTQFKSVEEMNETIITNWNRTVSPEDEIYILGDLQMSKSAEIANTLLRQLHGRKHLVRGNHDYWHKKQAFDKSLLESISDYKEIKVDKRRLCLFHYDIGHWRNRDYGSIHLHGHLHSSSTQNAHNKFNGVFKWDVGVDGNNFTPISVNKILDMFSDMPALCNRHDPDIN